MAAIIALKQPKNVSELRTQLGFVNYYKCYMPMMNELVADLNQLLKQGERHGRGPAQQVARDGLKAVFNRKGMVLRRIENGKQLILHIDVYQPRLRRGAGSAQRQWQ